MNRYIDAEWIRNVYADFEHYENRDDWTTPITNVLAVIEDAPTIEIIRCRECWHSKKIECEDGVFEYFCDISDLKWRADDFCSYGERKNDDDQFNSEINSNFMCSNVVNR